MAKVSAIQRNLKRRRMWERDRKKRLELKTMVMDKNQSEEKRFAAQLLLAALPRNSAKNRIRNRCSQTGRPRGYYRKFGISRIALRELGNWGLIPGVTKSSW